MAATASDASGAHSALDDGVNAPLANDYRAIAVRLTEDIDKAKLRTRTVGGGKQAVYAGNDVVL